jgi:hypothetical protein
LLRALNSRPASSALVSKGCDLLVDAGLIISGPETQIDGRVRRYWVRRVERREKKLEIEARALNSNTYHVSKYRDNSF